MKNRKSENEIELAQLKKIEQALYAMDFSEASNKERIEEKVFSGMKGRNKMNTKRKLSLRKIGIIAVAAATFGMVMQTTAAQELVEKVIKTISLGHISATQYEEEEWTEMAVPKTLAGKIYTKDGVEITTFTKDMSEFYTADGERIAHMDPKTGEVQTEKEYAEERSEKMLVEFDVNKINDYICFEAELPTYLPEGYTFDRAEFYKDEDGKVEDSKYIDLIFAEQATDKEIVLHERFADEETAYEMGTDGEIEEVQLNGVKAILSDNRNLDWEANGLLFSFSTRDNISKDELIKCAASIK